MGRYWSKKQKREEARINLQREIACLNTRKKRGRLISPESSFGIKKRERIIRGELFYKVGKGRGKYLSRNMVKSLTFKEKGFASCGWEEPKIINYNVLEASRLNTKEKPYENLCFTWIK
tara:strand:+ start:850 stop:1206 length:357 start_codon:yes stop_codon:yes gene_type:complete